MSSVGDGGERVAEFVREESDELVAAVLGPRQPLGLAEQFLFQTAHVA